jgi:hypothetical protein
MFFLIRFPAVEDTEKKGSFQIVVQVTTSSVNLMDVDRL